MMKVAITGASGDFGTAIIRRLLQDPAIESIVALHRRPLRVHDSRINSQKFDVNDADLYRLFEGTHVVIHLAFSVEEARDKTKAEHVNVAGSRNVVEACAKAGVKQLILASSVNAYGIKQERTPVDETTFPEGISGKYYFHHKAEVEHFISWWRVNMHSPMKIAVLRPCYVIGPDMHNSGIELFCSAVIPYYSPRRAPYQFLHQNDLADAFYMALAHGMDGTFNVGPDGHVTVQEIAEMHGAKVFPVGYRVAVLFSNIAFWLRLSPVSGQWVTAGEAVLNSSRFREATGWTPSMSCREAAAVMLLLAGRPLRLPGDNLRTSLAVDCVLGRRAIPDTPKVSNLLLRIRGRAVRATLHSDHDSFSDIKNLAVIVSGQPPQSGTERERVDGLLGRGHAVVLVDPPTRGNAAERLFHRGTTGLLQALKEHLQSVGGPGLTVGLIDASRSNSDEAEADSLLSRIRRAGIGWPLTRTTRPPRVR